MRVLVTGHRGYFGSVLTRVLSNARFDVVGLDTDLFAGCDFGRVQEVVPAFDMDIREVQFTDLLSFDAVVHLAGLTHAGSAHLTAPLTHEINFEATIRLAEACKEAQVSRFLFASSCSVYGCRGNGMLNEDSPVQPATPFDESKLRSESRLLEAADNGFVPVILRHAEMCGVSPRMCLDPLVNDFVASAVTTNQIVSRAAEFAWRPLVHVEDAARVYAAVLAAPDDRVRGQVFNLASSTENHRVIDVADAVCETVPGCRHERSPVYDDHRSYRVDGSKLAHLLDGFSFRWDFRRTLGQLRDAFLGTGFAPSDWRGDRYRRADRLRTLCDNGALDTRLRACGAALA